MNLKFEGDYDLFQEIWTFYFWFIYIWRFSCKSVL